MDKPINLNQVGNHDEVNLVPLVNHCPALKQQASDLKPENIMPANQDILIKKKSFKELFEAHCQKYAATAPKYSRKKACKLIGFPGITSKFSQWLRENEFLGTGDYPDYSLIERGIMDVHVKYIYKKVQYDSCDRPVSGSEYNSGVLIKSVYTPLFAEKGIQYFKSLLADEILLKAEVEKIKLSNTQYRINVI